MVAASYNNRCHIYSKKNVNGMALNRVVVVAVVYRTGMLAVTGSEHGNYFINGLLSFCFLFFYLVSSFRVNSCFRLKGIRIIRTELVNISCSTMYVVFRHHDFVFMKITIDCSTWPAPFMKGKIALPTVHNASLFKVAGFSN